MGGNSQSDGGGIWGKFVDAEAGRWEEAGGEGRESVEFLGQAESLHKLREPLGGEIVEVGSDVDRRVTEPGAQAFDGLADGGGGEVMLVDEEIVRMLGFDAVGFEDGFGKIGQIEGDDDAGLAEDRGGEDVAVIRVGKPECGGEFLGAGDEAVWDGLIHQAAGALEHFGAEIGTVPEEAADPLIVNAVGPARAEDSLDADFQQDVPKRRGVEDAGVEHGGERIRGSVPHVEFLGLAGEFIHGIVVHTK